MRYTAVMASILVSGATKKDRESYIEDLLNKLGVKVSANNPDLLVIDVLEGKKTIGIGQVRQATKFVNERPFKGDKKVLLVSSGEKLTISAQNAMLKTLEEHPGFTTIVVEAKTQKSMLETVVSRCKLVGVGVGEYSFKERLANISMVLNQSMGERLSWAAEFSKHEKEEVVETLEIFLSDLRFALNSKNAQNIEVVTKVKKDLEKTNVNKKLALEFLVLNLK